MAPAHTVLGLALLATRIRADETDDDATDSIFIDPDSFPDDWYGGLQLTQLFLAYCVILYFGCNMISDGAELLMLTPYSKLVGAVILPISGCGTGRCYRALLGHRGERANQLGCRCGRPRGLDGDAHHHPLVPRDLRRPRRS